MSHPTTQQLIQQLDLKLHHILSQSLQSIHQSLIKPIHHHQLLFACPSSLLQPIQDLPNHSIQTSQSNHFISSTSLTQSHQSYSQASHHHTLALDPFHGLVLSLHISILSCCGLSCIEQCDGQLIHLKLYNCSNITSSYSYSVNRSEGSSPILPKWQSSPSRQKPLSIPRTHRADAHH